MQKLKGSAGFARQFLILLVIGLGALLFTFHSDHWQKLNRYITKKPLSRLMSLKTLIGRLSSTLELKC